MNKITAFLGMVGKIIKGTILIVLIVILAKVMIGQVYKHISPETDITQATNSNTETVELSEADFKAKCVDYSYVEVTKDENTYKNAYIKGDFMVRQIATYKPTGETIYLCGESKGEGSYMGGLFYVLDRRIDKTRPIKLYDKIYMYGQVKELKNLITWDKNVMNPYIDAKYTEYKGKFGDAKE